MAPRHSFSAPAAKFAHDPAQRPIDRVVYAADRHDAARGGFDDLEIFELFARDPSTWRVRVDPITMPNGAQPFDTWLATADRVVY